MLREVVQDGAEAAGDLLLGGLARIEAAARRMEHQIDELLDLSVLETGHVHRLHRTTVDLVGLIWRVASEYQHAAQQHELRVDAEVPELVGRWDAKALERVVFNLVSNAVHYSPDGGRVAIRVGAEGGLSEPRAVVRVSDRGVGIPAADLPRVFDLFYRASNVVHQFSGTGIGLAAARQLVERHGGSIEVESVENVGTTFTVRLPLKHATR